MLSFELKGLQAEGTVEGLEIRLDRDGLKSLLAQLGFLSDGRTEHVHLISESWGGYDLESEPQGKNNTIIHLDNRLKK
jgi:hypothetical protein